MSTADEKTMFPIGPDLYIAVVDVAALKEQDLNAQIMQPREFDRLVENIRERGQLESLPYCHQPNLTGPISIVSGHHRFRAARAAGLQQIPVILDAAEMTRGEIISKQIAHNELHGQPDQEILRQLVSQISDVDDLLRTGLPDDWMPTVEKDDTALQIPHAEFDWRVVSLTFLPKQVDEFKSIISLIEGRSDLVGVAPVETFDAFAKAALAHGRRWDIKSMAASILTLTRLAEQEITDAEAGSTAIRLRKATTDRVAQRAEALGMTPEDFVDTLIWTADPAIYTPAAGDDPE
jgi:hypothetical protein